MQRKIESESGVTLIELLMVLAMLSVVFMIAYNLYALSGMHKLDEAVARYQTTEDHYVIHQDLDKEFVYAYYLDLKTARNDIEPNDITEDSDYYIQVDNGDIVIYRYENTSWSAYKRFSSEQGRYDIRFHFLNLQDIDSDRNEDIMLYNMVEYYIYFFKNENASLDLAASDYSYHSASMTVNKIGDWGVPNKDVIEGSTIHYRKMDQGVPTVAPNIDFRCFIATACFDSVQAPEVTILRAFRDRFLLSNPCGKVLVDTYYRYSPGIASVLDHNVVYKVLMRLILQIILSMVILLVYPQLLLIFFMILVMIWRPSYCWKDSSKLLNMRRL